ncbi:MAG: LacI family DNA-binding transcriptional regulator [Casimicrobium sp.]
MQERVRIEDVARAAGVSTATVSRTLSNPQLVKADRRESVLRAIKALGYAPDQSARALASGRTYTVGCVVPSIDHAIFAKSTQSLQLSLNEVGYQLLLASHDYDANTEHRAVITMQQRGVDALVLVGADHLPMTWRAIRSWGKPTFLTWSCDPRLPSVGFDNHAVATTVTEHLLKLGHRRIGLISGYTLNNDRARQRINGVRDTMARAGLTLKQELTTEQPFNLGGGRLGLQQLLSSRSPPTAIVCGNDLLAAGALLEAQRAGIDVPNSLSICGIDDQEWARELTPSLTTVSLPTSDLGRITAEHIVLALTEREFEKQRLLPFELIVRGSTSALSTTKRSRKAPSN